MVEDDKRLTDKPVRDAAEQPIGPKEQIGPERKAHDKVTSAPKNEPKLGPVDPNRPAPKAWSTHTRTGD